MQVHAIANRVDLSCLPLYSSSLARTCAESLARTQVRVGEVLYMFHISTDR